MLIEVQVAHAEQVGLGGLPLDRGARQGMFSILQRLGVLKNSDQRLFAGQSLLAIGPKVTALSLAGFRQGACLANGLKDPVDLIRRRLHPFDPTKHLGRAVTPIIPFRCKWKKEFAAAATFIFRSNRLDEPFDDAELVCRKEPSGQKAFWTQYDHNRGLPCLTLRPYYSCLTSNILADQLA
jgi:hypothetical protein